MCGAVLHTCKMSCKGMKFVPLEEAAKQKGVRVTFLPGVPALYSECLKNMLDCKGVRHTRALHPSFGRDQSWARKHSNRCKCRPCLDVQLFPSREETARGPPHQISTT